MNYLQQIINLSNENLSEDNYSDLVSIIQKFKPEVLNNHNLLLPFSVGSNPAYKPISWKNILLTHPYNKEINELFNKTEITDIIYWDNNKKSIILKTSTSKFLELAYQENKKEFLNKLNDQIKILIQNLPKNIMDIDSFVYKYSDDGEEHSQKNNQIIKLLDIVKDVSTLEEFLKSYPSFKDYFSFESEYYTSQPENQKRLSNYFKNSDTTQTSLFSEFTHKFTFSSVNDNIKGYISYLGLVNGLMKDDISAYLNNINIDSKDFKYPKYLKHAFIYMISHNKVDELSQLFKNIDLRDAFIKENITSPINQHYAQYIKNKEMLKFFIDLEIPVFYKNKTHNDPEDKKYYDFNKVMSIVDTLDNDSKIDKFDLNFIPYSYSEGLNAINSISMLTEVLPKLNNSQFLNCFENSLFTYNSSENFHLIYENIPNLNLSKVDVFYYLFNKSVKDLNFYKNAIDQGYDPRFCKNFIELACKKGLEGSKIIRALNKEGIVVSKNPDYLYNVYKYSKTKSLTPLFEKTSDEIFNKYTIDGYPAWWGALNKETLTFTSSKAFDVTQNAKSGQNIFQYFMNIFHTETHNFSDFNIIVEIVTNHLKDKNYKFDFTQPNPNTGNNIFHDLLNVATVSSSFKLSIINNLNSLSKDDLLNYLDVPNNKGVYPIDCLIELSLESNSTNAKKQLSILIKEHNNHISFNRKYKNDLTVGDAIMKIVSEDIQDIIEKRIMEEDKPKFKFTFANFSFQFT